MSAIIPFTSNFAKEISRLQFHEKNFTNVNKIGSGKLILNSCSSKTFRSLHNLKNTDDNIKVELVDISATKCVVY